MSDIKAARSAYEQAQKDALTLVERARLKLGKAIHEARQRDVPQVDIAKELKLTREQIRRFEAEYEKSLRQPAANT